VGDRNIIMRGVVIMQSKERIKNILFIVIFLCTQNAMAAGWSGATQVLDVYVHSNGNVFAQFEEAINPDSCPSTEFYRILNGETLQDFMFSMMLSAQTTGTTVRYYVSGCATYPLIKAVRTLK